MHHSSIIKTITFSFLFMLFCTPSIDAQEYKSAVGFRLGTFVAGTFKTFVSEKAAVEVSFGILREANQSQLNFGAFYKIHNSITQQVPTLKWYFGFGLFVNTTSVESERIKLAPSGTLGMEYTLDHTPVNFFVDLSPFYRFNAGPGFDIHASLGVRYVINRPGE